MIDCTWHRMQSNHALGKGADTNAKHCPVPHAQGALLASAAVDQGSALPQHSQQSVLTRVTASSTEATGTLGRSCN